MTVITVNGTEREAAPGANLADLVAEWCPSPRGVAVALNGGVVPKSGWEDTRLADGDVVEIVTAAAGG